MIQEEALLLGKPVLIFRTETERPETVEAGTVKLSGVIEDGIYNMASELLTNKNVYQKMVKAVNTYGDGRDFEGIVQAILHRFELGERPEEFYI